MKENTARIAVLAILLLLVFIPTFYLFSYILTRWEEIVLEVFNHPIVGDTYWRESLKYLSLSLRLAIITVVIDVIVGVPLSILLARSEFKGKGVLEDLSILPLVIPTSGFGFATMMAWTASYSLPSLLGSRVGLEDVIPIVRVPFLVLLVHVALTLPYIVKAVTAALRNIEKSYEVISESLGAHPLTTFRKVTLPMVFSSLISGSVLAFARSLGETGATLIVAGVSTTAPIAIVKWEFENKIAPASFLGALLVGLSLLVILPAEYVSRGKARFRSILPLKLDVKFSKVEHRIPPSLKKLRDLLSITFLLLIVGSPIAFLTYNTIVYWSRDPYTGKFVGSVLYELFGPSNYWSLILNALTTSFIVASISTLISTYIGVLTVVYTVGSKLESIVKGLLKIPLVVPTSALGLSMILLWGPKGLGVFTPGIWLIILTHIVFSVPVVAEVTYSAYNELNLTIYEETARTLGATRHLVVESIALPMMKRSIFAGAILCFTHSLGETGATFIVMGDHITISTLVVTMVESLAISGAMFASLLLIGISLFLVVMFRKII